jgi:hypothetical protein
VLMVADVYLLFKFAKAGPEAAMPQTVESAPAPVRSQDE